MKAGSIVLRILILACWSTFDARADDSSGGAASTNNLKIIWNVATNRWPSSVWTYQVIPQNFEPVIISNLMVLGHFADADRVKTKTGGERTDKQLIFFSNKGKRGERRELGISPLLGLIQFRDDGGKAKHDEEIRGVPSKDDTYQLALKYLREFGIDCSQLATKPGGTELRTLKLENTQGWLDKPTGTNAERVISRGLVFVRRVDGIDFNGNGFNGGARFVFGNDGRIAEMEISWRGLQHYRLHTTLSKDQMIEAIRDGKTKWGEAIRKPDEIKKLTVNDVTLLYQGERAENAQVYVEPLAILSTSLDYGSTNVSTYLECPIIDERE